MVMNQNVHLTNENQVTNGGRQLSFNDFNFSDHSVLSVKVRILEKKNLLSYQQSIAEYAIS